MAKNTQYAGGVPGYDDDEGYPVVSVSQFPRSFSFPSQIAPQVTTLTGVNSGDVLYTSDDVLSHGVHNVQVLAGVISIEISQDLTNWKAVSFEDFVTGTAVANSSDGGKLEGKFKYFRVLQSGAVPAQAIVTHGNK